MLLGAIQPSHTAVKNWENWENWVLGSNSRAKENGGPQTDAVGIAVSDAVSLLGQMVLRHASWKVPRMEQPSAIAEANWLTPFNWLSLLLCAISPFPTPLDHVPK